MKKRNHREEVSLFLFNEPIEKFIQYKKINNQGVLYSCAEFLKFEFLFFQVLFDKLSGNYK